MEGILNSLTCPITLEIIEDPVQLPCCGKSVSRIPLKQSLEIVQTCPLCRQDLSNFDINTAPTNRTLLAIVDSIKLSNSPKEVKDHQWSSNFEWIDKNKPYIGKLSLNVIRANFKTKKSIFIAVVDKSGSMSGKPIEQVKTALEHIIGLTSLKVSSIETRIILYSSTASCLPIMNDKSILDFLINEIKKIKGNGGTNFLAAYDKISDNLESLREDAENIDSVSIAFLTDGQAQNDKSQLTYALGQIFEPYKKLFKIIVHSIGFSSNCDKELLEKMRTAGTNEGTFRYAEPNDNSDALCNKLTDIFSLSEKASTIKIHVTLPNELIFFETNTQSKDCFIHVDAFSKAGTLTEWIINKNSEKSSRYIITIDSSEDNHKEVVSMYKNDISDKSIIEEWLRKMLDLMAKELLEMNKNRNNISPNLLKLQCALFQSRLKTIGTKIDDNRVNYMKNQIDAILAGGVINEGKIADMRFSSMFAPEIIKKEKKPIFIKKESEKKLQLIEIKENYVKYSFNNEGKERNELQKEIINAYPKRFSQKVIDFIKSSKDEDILHKDINGNTALHLAAYCGSDTTIKKIFEHFSLDIKSLKELIMLENKDNETSLTLAIKKKGYHDSLKLLTGAGGYLPKSRVEPLKKYCINNGYVRTAEMISNLNIDDSEPKLDLSASESYLRFQWDSAIKNNKEILSSDWLQPMLAKGLIDIVEILLKKEHIRDFIIPWKWFIDYCFPPKPDHPEVDKYVKLASMILKFQPSLINERDPEKGDTTLICSVDKGNLPLVQLMLDNGAKIDEKNNLGNTALMVACSKRYPCIVTELIKRKASINIANKKGNRAITFVCQMGPLKTLEILIANGAETEFFNINGDTPLLIACRNGQCEVAKLLLQYYNKEYILFRAKIDGFDALFASVEQNRPDCVKLILDNGVPVDEKTDTNNEILAESTPLHLAAYYGRYESAKVLLDYGSDTNAKNINRMTPLHLAVMRNHEKIVELLIKYNANSNVYDMVGNTPASYTRNKNIIYILSNPLVEQIHKICCTPLQNLNIKINDLKEILLNKSFVLGINNAKTVLSNALDKKGRSPLTTAIIYSNIEVVEILAKIGVDPSLTDNKGLSAYVWSQLTKNVRIQTLINTPKNEMIETKRVREKGLESPETAMLLFLGKPPSSSEVKDPCIFNERMQSVNLLSNGTDFSIVQKRKALIYDDKSPSIFSNEINEKKNQNSKELLISETLLFEAKVESISSIASGLNQELSPSQLISIFMFSADRNFYQAITYYLCGKYSDNEPLFKKIMFPLTKCLLTSIDILPSFDSEVYAFSLNINRKIFTVGNIVSSPSFISCTSLWPVAIESINFEKEGTIFLIKSVRYGKHIASYSKNPNECEVVFPPLTKFIVNKWYRGDVIALGQPNIREHTFSLNEEQQKVISNNSKPLIIELHEL